MYRNVKKRRGVGARSVRRARQTVLVVLLGQRQRQRQQQQRDDDDSDDEGNRPDHSYVLTAPPHVVRLNPTDTLYIIATTAWAWSNLPELIEASQGVLGHLPQRQFRMKCEQRREKERLEVQKAAGYGVEQTPGSTEQHPGAEAIRAADAPVVPGRRGAQDAVARPDAAPRPRSTSPP